MRLSILDGAKRFVTVACETRAVALVLQNAGDQIPNISFIINDQNVSGHLRNSWASNISIMLSPLHAQRRQLGR